MFISNTATTSMMLPIMEAVMHQLEMTDEERRTQKKAGRFSKNWFQDLTSVLNVSILNTSIWHAHFAGKGRTKLAAQPSLVNYWNVLFFHILKASEGDGKEEFIEVKETEIGFDGDIIGSSEAAIDEKSVPSGHHGLPEPYWEKSDPESYWKRNSEY